MSACIRQIVYGFILTLASVRKKKKAVKKYQKYIFPV